MFRKSAIAAAFVIVACSLGLSQATGQPSAATDEAAVVAISTETAEQTAAATSSDPSSITGEATVRASDATLLTEGMGEVELATAGSASALPEAMAQTNVSDSIITFITGTRDVTVPSSAGAALALTAVAIQTDASDSIVTYFTGIRDVTVPSPAESAPAAPPVAVLADTSETIVAFITGTMDLSVPSPALSAPAAPEVAASTDLPAGQTAIASESTDVPLLMQAAISFGMPDTAVVTDAPSVNTAFLTDSTNTAGLLFTASSVVLSEPRGQSGTPASTTTVLTEGTDMDNFVQAGNANWRIAERTISADLGSGFLVTKQSYDDFRIRAEVWVDEDANSGIFIRCDNPQAPGAQSCYEINIFDSNPNRNNATGSIVGVRAVSNFQSTALKWNVIEVEAKGSQINVTVNGVRTASARDTRHARGRIALQYNGGVVRWHKVEITSLTAEDIAAGETPFYVNCEAGFVIQFPGQPMVRDVRYRTSFGTDAPAKQYYIERDGKIFTETVAEFPNGARSDGRLVSQALEEIGKKGEVRFRAFGDYDPGMPGGQLNIFQADGKQTRASVYMADRRLYMTEVTAPVGDTEALFFEQTITLVDRAGGNMDRVNAINDPGPPYDCR